MTVLAMGGYGSFTRAFAEESSEVQQLLDKEAIRELMAQFAYFWDDKDAEGWVGLFTQDGSWELWFAGAQEPARSVKTHEVMLPWAKERFEGSLATHRTRYLRGNTIFLELSDTTARTKTEVIGLHTISGENVPKVVITGSYEEEFHKTPEGWRVHRCVVRTDLDPPNQQ